MRTLVLGVVCSFLAACSTTWHSNNFPDEASEKKQLKKDTGYCRAVSYGAVPMPATRVYIPEKSSYNIQGTATGYDREGQYTSYTYTGTATPRMSPATSFTSGFAQGMAMGSIIRENAERDDVFDACMINLGWSDKPLPKELIDTSPQPRQIKTSESPKISDDALVEERLAGPTMISCGVYSDNRTPGKFLGNGRVFNYIIDKKNKTVKTTGGKNLTVRSWAEDEIITDSKDYTVDTIPPMSAYSIIIFNRATGAYRTMGVWRTNDRKHVEGNELKKIAGKHPLWQVWPFGIWERRDTNGDCEAVRQKF